MKWLGYIISVLTGISLLLLLIGINDTLTFVLIPLYGGLFTYWCFRKTWKNRKSTIKKITIIGIIMTILLIAENIYINQFNSQMNNLADTGGMKLLPMFSVPSIISTIIFGLIFIVLPLILSFLEGLNKPDQEGFVRNPLVVLIYSILTFGIYNIYWFWLIKKALSKRNIESTTLWWFLLPIVGSVIVYVKFSYALEKRTQIKFITWFLIFFLLNNIDLLVVQILLNKYISKQNSPQPL